MHERPTEFFELACKNDLEGVVAKYARGTYQSGSGTSWLKIKNPQYSPIEGRHELFEARRTQNASRRRLERPTLILA